MKRAKNTKSSKRSETGKSSCRLAVFGLALICLMLFCAQPVSAKDADGNIVIVIDPGHGGEDPGTVGGNGVKEADVNLEIARAMMAELKQYENVRVYLTRPEDGWNTNTGRAMVAAEMDADFLISLHNNSGADTNSGAIVYTSVLPLYSAVTADMGNRILENLERLGIRNNGIQTRDSTQYAGEDYYTIMAEAMRAGTPAVLVEHVFLSNASDTLHVSCEDGSLDYEKISQIGKADAAAVISYFNLQKNMAVADQASTVILERGYSVWVEPETKGAGNISWISSNSAVVTVNKDGLATAVGSGSATIMYSYEDKTNGYLTVNVAVPGQTALVGAIKPTFYYSQEEFNKIDLSAVFAEVMYSDGSVVRVKPDHVGGADLSKTWIQDIPITYGTLSGSVRVIFSPPDYAPEPVTQRAQQNPTPEQTQNPTSGVIQNPPQSPKQPQNPSQAPKNSAAQGQAANISKIAEKFDARMLFKLMAGIGIVSFLASILYLFEGKRRKRK